ncbi:arylamine N-acetyltransferase [Bacillus capparidis]|uniref:Arylamine N-acetyltransferase n=1 Tax=Bacillus capparidis TaxID=1840411 RepID=A0ABS4D3N7_9BACI|nr:arylamine N-acetyltransferase [Bacillus capparidis]
MAIIVKMGKEKLYVDCGGAAPIFKPVRFESDHQNSSRFGEDYVNIVPTVPEDNNYRYVRYIKGKQSGEAWDFNSEQEYKMSDFADIIQKSYILQSAFMSILRCQLWQIDQNRSVSLVNNRLSIHYSDGQTVKKTLSSIHEIEEVMAIDFFLPKLPVAEAIEVLKNLGVDVFSDRV